MKLTLKSFLTEARQADVAYEEKKAKNAVVKVIAELKGHEAGVLSRLARRFDRLKVAIERMTEARKGLNAELKGRVEDLFDAADAVCTRVVDTAGFTLTLAKQAEKPDDKVVVDWEQVAAELVKLVPDELQDRIDQILEAYTKISIMDVPEPGLRVTNKAAKAAGKAVSLEEGVVDKLKKLVSRVLKQVRSWGARYDKRLAGLKARLEGEPLAEAKAKAEAKVKPTAKVPAVTAKPKPQASKPSKPQAKPQRLSEPPKNTKIYLDDLVKLNKAVRGDAYYDKIAGTWVAHLHHPEGRKQELKLSKGAELITKRLSST